MSTPIQLIFVFAIAAALVIECESLKCYFYAAGTDRTEKMCTNAKYCVKEMMYDVLIGSCDDYNVICSSNGCYGVGDNQVCCCDTDLCNFVEPTVTPCVPPGPCNTGNFVASTLTATAVSLIFVFFSRYITY